MTVIGSVSNDPRGGVARPIGCWVKPRHFALGLALRLFSLFPHVLVGVRGFFFRDFGFFSYPLAYYHRQSFWRGEVPLWNPLSNCGIPFLAQWNTVTLYPGSLFYLFLPMPWSLGMFCLLHQVLAGLGMYFLARRWTGNRLAASVAGLAFAFNGLTLNSLMWPSTMAALGWMPWVMHSVEPACKFGGRKMVTAATLGAMQMLSGGPEIILFTWGLLAALSALELMQDRPPQVTRLRRFVLLIVSVAGICAVQLLPFLDLFKNSHRSGADVSSESSMPPWGWANYLVPLFHCYRSSAGVFFQDGQRWTSSYYLGAGILAMAGLALFVAKHWRVRLLACAAVFGLIMALGDAGFLYPRLRHILPVVGAMNFPVKFTLLVTFVAPLLAAIALGNLAGASRERKESIARCAGGIGLALVVLVGLIALISFIHPLEEGEWSAVWPNALVRAVILLLTLFALREITREPGLRKREMLGAGLLFLLWIDIYTHAPPQNPTVTPRVYENDLQPVRKLDPIPRPGETRAMVSLVAIQKFSFHLLSDPVAGYIGPRLGLHDDCNLLENIPKVDGFFALHLREETEVRRRLYWETNSPLERIEDYLGVSEVTAEGKFFEWTARTNYLPMSTAGQKPVFTDSTGSLVHLADPGFDPREVVFLQEEARLFLSANSRTPARILDSRVTAHKVELRVVAPAPSVVVLSQSFYPSWRAEVDGRPARLWRANHAFQAVEVPAGTHDVRLIYRDNFFQWGALVSCLSLGTIAAGRFTRRRARS